MSATRTEETSASPKQRVLAKHPSAQCVRQSDGYWHVQAKTLATSFWARSAKCAWQLAAAAIHSNPFSVMAP